jgi:hypothetical protein
MDASGPQIDVEAEGFEAQRVERTLPGAGGQLDLAIELEPRHERATLLVSFEPEGDAPLPVAFRFRREGGDDLSASSERGLYHRPLAPRAATS